MQSSSNTAVQTMVDEALQRKSMRAVATLSGVSSREMYHTFAGTTRTRCMRNKLPR